MAGRLHRGNEEKGDEVRRRPGPDTLEKKIGKVADSHINPYIHIQFKWVSVCKARNFVFTDSSPYFPLYPIFEVLKGIMA
jgi:hypothetical protein